MKVISFEQWAEDNKNELFNCETCNGSGEVKDHDFDDYEDHYYTCPACCGNKQDKLKNFSKKRQYIHYKSALHDDLKKYCEATGKDFEAEWEKIKLSTNNTDTHGPGTDYHGRSGKIVARNT